MFSWLQHPENGCCTLRCRGNWWRHNNVDVNRRFRSQFTFKTDKMKIGPHLTVFVLSILVLQTNVLSGQPLKQLAQGPRGSIGPRWLIFFSKLDRAVFEWSRDFGSRSRRLTKNPESTSKTLTFRPVWSCEISSEASKDCPFLGAQHPGV